MAASNDSPVTVNDLWMVTAFRFRYGDLSVPRWLRRLVFARRRRLTLATEKANVRSLRDVPRTPGTGYGGLGSPGVARTGSRVFPPAPGGGRALASVARKIRSLCALSHWSARLHVAVEFPSNRRKSGFSRKRTAFLRGGQDNQLAGF